MIVINNTSERLR